MANISDFGGLDATNPCVKAAIQHCVASYQSTNGAIVSAAAGVRPLIGSGNSWLCSWGPASDADDANLVYVAVCSEDATKKPIAAYVVIRGTDFGVDDAFGWIRQVWEDADVTNQRPLPWLAGQPDVQIAQGTLDGLDTIAQLSAGGHSLIDHLNSILALNADVLFVVTGHSLGGCLSSVVAPWLTSSIPNTKFTPITFAAPSAGNQAFANYVAGLLPESMRICNPLDIAPLAWSDLADVKKIYSGLPAPIDAPLDVAALVEGFKMMLDARKASYIQAGARTLRLPTKPDVAEDFLGQVLAQHAAVKYRDLIG